MGRRKADIPQAEISAAIDLLKDTGVLTVAQRHDLTTGTVARVMTWLAYPHMATPTFAAGIAEHMLAERLQRR